jgi:hypothetical protein
VPYGTAGEQRHMSARSAVVKGQPALSLDSRSTQRRASGRFLVARGKVVLQRIADSGRP